MRFYCIIFLFLWVSNISSQKFHTNYYVYLRGGPNLTKLKGYEKYLGNNLIKSFPSFGYEANCGIQGIYKKLGVSTSFGFKKSKSNLITLTEPYDVIAQFEENFVRIDLIKHTFIANFEIGFQLFKKHSIHTSILQSLDTYHRATLIYNETLEYPVSNPGYHGSNYTNFYLLPNHAETIFGISWAYDYANKWNISFKVSTTLIPYELTYETMLNSQRYKTWLLPIHECAIGFYIQYTIFNSKKT